MATKSSPERSRAKVKWHFHEPSDRLAQSPKIKRQTVPAAQARADRIGIGDCQARRRRVGAGVGTGTERGRVLQLAKSVEARQLASGKYR